MLGFSISVYDGDDENHGKLLCSWAHDDYGIWTKELDRNPKVTSYSLNGYPISYTTPVALVREKLLNLGDCKRNDPSNLMKNRQIIAGLKDDDMIYIEEWDRS